MNQTASTPGGDSVAIASAAPKTVPGSGFSPDTQEIGKCPDFFDPVGVSQEIQRQCCRCRIAGCTCGVDRLPADLHRFGALVVKQRPRLRDQLHRPGCAGAARTTLRLTLFLRHAQPLKETSPGHRFVNRQRELSVESCQRSTVNSAGGIRQDLP